MQILDQSRRLMQLASHLGPRWVAYRLYYGAKLKSGWLMAQLPCGNWADHPLATRLSQPELAAPEALFHAVQQIAGSFFVRTTDRPRFATLFSAWDEAAATAPSVAFAEKLLRGEFTYFGHEMVSLHWPPDWHLDPFSGCRQASDRHWTQIGDFANGDIKFVWELSRFTFTFTLVRAYWRTGDVRFAEAFWQLVESWRVNNPPQSGPNWKCGQELSFRVMAWCFGLFALLDSPATTVERVQQLVQMLAVSGERIEANLEYALSQQNNHGLSEATGLWTLGILFPWLKRSRRWTQIGRAALEQQVESLILDDGSFSQQSVNYHRVMLHDMLWAIRLGETCETPLSSRLTIRVRAAVHHLCELVEPESGRAPNYGHNDGALVLPLTNCDFTDYRPVIQAGAQLLDGCPRFAPGPWDEECWWLNGPAAAVRPSQTDTNSTDGQVSSPEPYGCNAAGPGGYFVLRSPHSKVFTRAASFRHRPAHADLLHVDLWWRGQNIALDAGTYSYNSPDPWNNGLAGTAVHNTVTVDGRDQMDRASRFLWLPWAEGHGETGPLTAKQQFQVWVGSHDGYTRLADPVQCRRTIARLGDEAWCIIDDLESREPHRMRLHWLLIDGPHQHHAAQHHLELLTPAGRMGVWTWCNQPLQSDLVRADETSNRGWRSLRYRQKIPALSWAHLTRGSAVRFVTIFSPLPGEVEFEATSPESLEVSVCGRDLAVTATLASSPSLAAPALTRLAMSHPVVDHWEN